MSFGFRLSRCGRDFDEYVARVFGPWDPDGPESRTLGDLWHGRRLKIHQGGKWKEGRVLSWTHSFEVPEEPAKWRLELEMVDDGNDEHSDKRRKVVKSSGETHAEVQHAVRTTHEVQTLKFQVNRMNIEGGGTLKPVSSESSTDLISLEWMQPAEPVLDFCEGALSYRCPYCRAIEPVVAAHEDPSLERNAECPVCLEMCACRVLQCGHSICHSCWDRCRRVATVSSVEVDELDVEQIEKDRAERHVVGFTEALLRERLSAFAHIAHEASSGKEGLTRFYRELMVEHPTIWMNPILHPLYEEMSMKGLKILLQALEDRKFEFLSGIGPMTERMFHVMSAAAAVWIAESHKAAGQLRLSIPWLHLTSYHMAKQGCESDEVKTRCTALGSLHLKYGQLTQALHSFDECLHLDADDEEAREGREGVLREMKKWTGASGKLTPKC